MNNRRKIFEWTLDGLTILVAIVLVKVAVTRYFPSSRAAGAVLDTFKPGSSFNLDNTDWANNGSTLVMGLQTGCRWCEASMSFYSDILHSNTNNSVHVIALFPQPVSEAQVFLHRYLHQLGDKVTIDVRKVSFDKLGIRETPTLVLLVKHGHVQSSWVGKLSSEQENDVFEALKIRRVRSPVSVEHDVPAASNMSSDLISAAQFVMLRRRVPTLLVIDVDPRSVFRSGHIVGALNIPVNEIEDRAVHEVPGNTIITIYCNYCPPCENSRNSQGINSTCSVGNLFLRQQGFSQVKMLAADLNQLARAGVKVTGARNRN